jgi:hypothetical protein
MAPTIGGGWSKMQNFYIARCVRNEVIQVPIVSKFARCWNSHECRTGSKYGVVIGRVVFVSYDCSIRLVSG